MSTRNDLLKNTFSSVINDYEYARPKYPQELYEQLLTFSRIDDKADILEVGAGTGQATDLFLQNGDYSIDLLEVSEEQAEFLREKYKSSEKVNVICSYFEEYDEEKQYDLIYSATAFHWIDSEVGYPKAYRILKNGGIMAVFWQMSSVTYYDFGIFKGLNDIKKKYLPEETLGFDEKGIQKVKEKRIKQIQSGGYFREPECYEFRWTDTYDADRYVALINTYSSTQLLEEMVRTAYLDEIHKYIDDNGGIVEMPQLVMLYLVKKEFDKQCCK